jgi:thiol-disulfide isomerase/thioredoxin
MRKLIPLILISMLLVNAAGQSGRKIARPTQPLPPVQATVFSEPEIEPNPTPSEEVALSVLPDGLKARMLAGINNRGFRLADFKDKVIVINLWASWCGPCRREVPVYESVRQEYADRPVEFIGLALEDPRNASGQVKAFVRDLNFGFRLAWADRESAQQLTSGFEGIPQTLVIAPGGRVLDHWEGFSRKESGDHLRSVLQNALDKL